MEIQTGVPDSAIKELSYQLHENAKQLGLILQQGKVLEQSLGVDISQNLRNKLKEDALMLFRLASSPSEYVAHIALNVKLIPHLR